MTVGLVLVSHSAAIAAGLVELARQMAPTAPIAAAGGTDDGGIGTSAGMIEAGIRAVSQGDGVVVIGDLGSAILTAETVVDLLDAQPAGGIRVLDVPLVEGGVAAAVAAESGATIDGVERAASGDSAAAGGGVVAEVVLADPDGLHARPAAELVRTAARFRSAISVDGADARSLLAVLALGRRHGTTVTVTADGPDAREAIAAVVRVLGPA